MYVCTYVDTTYILYVHMFARIYVNIGIIIVTYVCTCTSQVCLNVRITEVAIKGTATVRMDLRGPLVVKVQYLPCDVPTYVCTTRM